MRVFRGLGVSSPEIVCLVSTGPSHEQSEERKRLALRPSSCQPVSEKHRLIFEKGDDYMDQGLLLPHQIEDVPRGASSAPERGHESVGVANGLRVSNGEEECVW